jgi:hypothetical protein
VTDQTTPEHEDSETGVLVNAVDALTEGFTQVAAELQKLSRTYERDRRFRRAVTGALIFFTLAGMAIGGIAISTSYELRAQVRSYRLESCLRGNVLRQDIYVAVDAVLDSIAPAANEDGREALAGAKAAVRREIPLRDCD